jgi:hypothetical protein
LQLSARSSLPPSKSWIPNDYQCGVNAPRNHLIERAAASAPLSCEGVA